MQDRLLVEALVRNDFLSFIMRTFDTLEGGKPFFPNWHIELIADRLQQAFDRKIKRLIINVPPRSLKSICASVALPAWALGRDPTLRIVCASYSQDLAGKLARDCRTVMDADWYRRAFPHTRLNRDKRAEGEFETTKGGYRLSTSVGGTLTGRGGNFVIIDDPIKPQDAYSDARRQSANEWFDSTLLSRLNDQKTDVIIIIMQRVHIDDLTAHVMEKGGWEVLCLPLIAEQDESFRLSDGNAVGRKSGELLHAERVPREVAQQLRISMGELAFSAQYQQAPVPVAGNLIKRHWLRTYDCLPKGNIIQSWDVAMTTSGNSDWSVCTTWCADRSRKQFCLVDVLRDRFEFPALKRAVVRQAQRFDAKTVLIEKSGVGIGLVQQLRDEGQVLPIGLAPENSKVARMEAQSTRFESGSVLLPTSASWLDVYKTELLSFPGGRHDDQVDSTSQFLNWIESRRPRAGVLF
ncbi:phage terminase large subunit [Hyphomicrobium sp. LHD-15]|uniref:phage terminase large subunit n=1 Tax=Hyphomicrobium sp. LHD-15 TaxID=3072142 RepID=UPI0028105D29|nr:phage terminase large subunit [Hyphomicrobium sp. LHD-15]MDQ8699207.1 phage terminase large subunit [Hyphomicrobium sp. LHD-15]